jgi:hypothetical protein
MKGYRYKQLHSTEEYTMEGYIMVVKFSKLIQPFLLNSQSSDLEVRHLQLFHFV